MFSHFPFFNFFFGFFGKNLTTLTPVSKNNISPWRKVVFSLISKLNTIGYWEPGMGMFSKKKLGTKPFFHQKKNSLYIFRLVFSLLFFDRVQKIFWIFEPLAPLIKKLPLVPRSLQKNNSIFRYWGPNFNHDVVHQKQSSPLIFKVSLKKFTRYDILRYASEELLDW